MKRMQIAMMAARIVPTTMAIDPSPIFSVLNPYRSRTASGMASRGHVEDRPGKDHPKRDPEHHNLGEQVSDWPQKGLFDQHSQGVSLFVIVHFPASVFA